MLFSAVNKCTDPEIFKFLIDNGINIHAENDIALYQICMRINMRTKFEVFKLLLEAGVKINEYNRDSDYSGQFARYNPLQIEAGSSPIGYNPHIIFALTIFPESYGLNETDIKIVKLLIEYGLLHSKKQINYFAGHVIPGILILYNTY